MNKAGVSAMNQESEMKKDEVLTTDEAIKFLKISKPT